MLWMRSEPREWLIYCARRLRKFIHLFDLGGVVERVGKEAMKFAILEYRTAGGKFYWLGRFASDNELAKFLAAEWRKRGYLLPTAHSVDWE